MHSYIVVMYLTRGVNFQLTDMENDYHGHAVFATVDRFFKNLLSIAATNISVGSRAF